MICHLLRSSRQKGRSEQFLFILDEGPSRKHALADTLAYRCVIDFALSATATAYKV